jgi:hypothetical protein
MLYQVRKFLPGRRPHVTHSSHSMISILDTVLLSTIAPGIGPRRSCRVAMRNACQENRCLKWAALRRAKIDSGSAQWISNTFVETANLIAVVTAISNLHPRTECPNRRKLLDCEADSFRRGVEPSIVDRMAPPALWNEQLCGCVVVDLHIRQIVRSSSLSLATRSKGSLTPLMRY